LINLHDSWAGVCPLLGPALYVWVQGCPLRCRGCANPETLPFVEARRVAPAVLAGELAASGARALVLSGGEPFSQAEALAELCALVRTPEPGLPVLVYTGYTMGQLLAGTTEQLALLKQVDVVVDGPFSADEACDHPLLGSANQRIWRLGQRVSHEQLARLEDSHLQISVKRGGQLRLVGTGRAGAHMGQLARLVRSRGVALRPARNHAD
jgi:anaerobic ribonucleoside-triphosphate reductase activating protein